MAEQIGDSARSIQRYIRLTELIPDLLDYVDKKRLQFTVAVDISYIDKEIQTWLFEYIKENGTVKAVQVAALRTALEVGPMTQAKMISILVNSQPGRSRRQRQMCIRDRDNSMNFEYYYGTQADQFSFIRIPRILLLDKAFSALSLSAKVLYSVLLDRMGLSMKNKWLDEENKVYIIYQITEIQSDLGFSKKKTMDYLTELEKIGLIEKKKRGFGLPNIIYVKSFMAHQSSQRSNEMGTSQEKDVVHRSIEMGTPEVMNKHLRGAETDTSEVPNSGLQEVPKTVPLYNKTYMNYNNQSNMKSNHIKSDGDRIRCDQKEQTINAYAELVKKNIDFDVLLHTYSREQDLVEEIYQLILETVQTEKDMIRIAGEYYPAGFVKGKLLKLNYSHIEYVLECMDKNTTKVRNIKQYLLAALFNAPSTIGSYYKAEVNHDMPQYAN